MTQGRPTISTHVLDTATGLPAQGVTVRVERVKADGGGEPAGAGTTDEDGRVRDLLAGAEQLPGTYRLIFSVEGRFFRRVALDVRIEDASRSHHVPLLLAPYGVTSYRGS